MGLLSFFPKEDKFYRMLDEMALTALSSVQELDGLFGSVTEEAKSHANKELAELKSKAKQIQNEITTEVSRTFITPFDREDLQAISNALYRITNTLENIKTRFFLLNLSANIKDFKEFTQILNQQGTLLQQLIKGLRNIGNAQPIFDASKRILELEDQADELLVRLLSQLFNDHTEARELILRKDLYDMLENVTDVYRDAANVAICVVLKHS